MCTSNPFLPQEVTIFLPARFLSRSLTPSGSRIRSPSLDLLKACVEGCKAGARAAVDAACRGHDAHQRNQHQHQHQQHHGDNGDDGKGGNGGEDTTGACGTGEAVCAGACAPLRAVIPFPTALDLCLKSCRDGVRAVCHQKFGG